MKMLKKKTEMRSRELSDFIFEGRARNVKVGDRIETVAESVFWREQEGDIPAMYGLSYELNYEISCLNGIIIGIKFQLWHRDEWFTIQPANGKAMDFGMEATFLEFIQLLNDAKIDWRVDKLDSDDKTVAILLPSNTMVAYSFGPDVYEFFYVGIFNLALLNQLSSEIHKNTSTNLNAAPQPPAPAAD